MALKKLQKGKKGKGKKDKKTKDEAPVEVEEEKLTTEWIFKSMGFWGFGAGVRRCPG